MHDSSQSDRLRHWLADQFADYIADVILSMNDSWIEDDLLEDACGSVIEGVARTLEAKQARNYRTAKPIVDEYADLVSLRLDRWHRR